MATCFARRCRFARHAANTLLPICSLKASHLPHLTDSSVAAVLRKCPLLEHLDVSHGRGITGKCFLGRSDGGLMTASVFSLKYLDISYCKHLIPGTLYYVGAGLVQLEDLHISHYTAMVPNEVESLSASAGKHLRSFDVSGWDISEKVRRSTSPTL